MTATIQLHTCPRISNKHLYMSYIMHTIHVRCMYLTQCHNNIHDYFKHFLCILYILDVSISHNVTVVSSTIKHFLCILYILDVPISHNVTVVSSTQWRKKMFLNRGAVNKIARKVCDHTIRLRIMPIIMLIWL